MGSGPWFNDGVSDRLVVFLARVVGNGGRPRGWHQPEAGPRVSRKPPSLLLCVFPHNPIMPRRPIPSVKYSHVLADLYIQSVSSKPTLAPPTRTLQSPAPGPVGQLQGDLRRPGISGNGGALTKRDRNLICVGRKEAPPPQQGSTTPTGAGNNKGFSKCHSSLRWVFLSFDEISGPLLRPLGVSLTAPVTVLRRIPGRRPAVASGRGSQRGVPGHPIPPQ